MAQRQNNQLVLHDRVISKVALPGVPQGTPGKVILTNGFSRDGVAAGRSWVRYRVLFETDDRNGTDVGSLDRDSLTLIDKNGNPIS